MKFIGIFVLAVALYGSWQLFNGEKISVSESTHIQIQKTLSSEIEQIIADSNSLFYDIEVYKFWTKEIDKKTLSFHFTVGYKEKTESEPNIIEKKGYAVLKKIKQEKNTQYWQAMEVKLEGQKIQFNEGLTLTGNENE